MVNFAELKIILRWRIGCITSCCDFERVIGNRHANKTFGLTRNVYVRGTVFNDSNGDKLRGAGEGGL